MRGACVIRGSVGGKIEHRTLKTYIFLADRQLNRAKTTVAQTLLLCPEYHHGSSRCGSRKCGSQYRAALGGSSWCSLAVLGAREKASATAERRLDHIRGTGEFSHILRNLSDQSKQICCIAVASSAVWASFAGVNGVPWNELSPKKYVAYRKVS